MMNEREEEFSRMKKTFQERQFLFLKKDLKKENNKKKTAMSSYKDKH